MHCSTKNIAIQRNKEKDPNFYKMSSERREKHNLNMREYRRKNKEKNKCRLKTSYLVASGVLVRPEICPQCGANEKIEAHHNDYSNPYEVEWLCLKCHRDTHKKLRDTDPYEILKPSKDTIIKIPSLRKLSNQQEDEIVKMYLSKITQKKIAKVFGLTQSGISYILKRKICQK